MAKRSKRKKPVPVSDGPPPPGRFPGWRLTIALSLLLALVAFLVYAPSLRSGFVYDGRIEILEEGFITTFSHIWDVLTLKVLAMSRLNLSPRPGQMLYLMLIAAWSGQSPFGYHLGSNLLHAANVALFFVVVIRLTKEEAGSITSNQTKILLAAARARCSSRFIPSPSRRFPKSATAPTCWWPFSHSARCLRPWPSGPTLSARPW